MDTAPKPVGLLLCTCQPSLARSLDLEALLAFLQQEGPLAASDRAPELCRRPEAVAAFVTRHHLEGLVIGGCGEETVAWRWRTAAQKGGMDPFAVEVVRLAELAALVHDPPAASEKAKLLLLAALRRSSVFPGTTMEGLKPTFAFPEQRLSRRALFSLARPRYTVVPTIVHERCAAERGCQLCLPACPLGALKVEDGSLILAKERCESCVRCVVACPRGALALPTFARERLEGSIVALRTATVNLPPTRILLFAGTCTMPLLEELGHRRQAYAATVLPVEVPCAGAVPPSFLLRAFDLGMAGVGLLVRTERCRHGLEAGGLASARAFVQAILEQYGVAPERLQVIEASPGKSTTLAATLSAFAATVEELGPTPLQHAGPSLWSEGHPSLPLLLRGMADKRLRSESLSFEEAPVGVVEVAADRCTLCGLCADRCFAEALRLERDGEVALHFDYLRCVACYECVRICPEAKRKAIRVEPVLDWQRLEYPQGLLLRDQMMRCQRCGAAIAPQAMTDKLLQTLRKRNPQQDLRYVTQLCPDCRIFPFLLKQ